MSIFTTICYNLTKSENSLESGGGIVLESVKITDTHVSTKDISHEFETLPRMVSLEEEITTLRHKMEQAVWRENSLTSESVVNLSRMLDNKINQFMKHKLKRN